MNTDESVFDYLAAAEEIGRLLEEMTTKLPGEVKTALLEEWRISSWRTEFPKSVEAIQVASASAQATVEEIKAAALLLSRTVTTAGIAICLTSIVIPLAVWGIAYLNTKDLREE